MCRSGESWTLRSPPTGNVEVRSSACFPFGRRGNPPPSTVRVGGLPMAQEFTHEPVMVEEVTALLAPFRFAARPEATELVLRRGGTLTT